jgi:hypothetical protein
MKKVLVILLAVVCTVSGIAAQEKTAGETTAKKQDTAPKEERWHGTILRSDKSKSMLVVAKKMIEKTVLYNSSTKWTEGKKMADPNEFADGSEVIVLGNYDKDKNLVATRIDLRRK